MNYYAVKSFDGAYLEVGCEQFTFDRNEMQLFLDEETAEIETLKTGYSVDDEQIFVVSIEESQLIQSILETSVVLGIVKKDKDIEKIRSIVPNPYRTNTWYTGKLNGKELEVMVNSKGFYHVRKLVDSYLVSKDENTREYLGKRYDHYRINKKGELIYN